MASRFQPLLLTALAATALAACAPESASPDDARTGATAAAAPAAGKAAANAPVSRQDTLAASLSAARAGEAIASYPDRGDLVGYDRTRQVKRNGGNTFYPVQVSEAHALASIGSGTLEMTGPDGRQVSLKYERHVEHPSGDWSWIGRDGNGIEGILTFGEKAVFGVLPYGEDDTLRLTTNAGQAYMAAATKGVLSPLQQRIRDGVAPPDFLVPPGASALAAEALDVEASAAAAIGAAAAPVQAAAAGGTTLDLVLGYTPGFASMMGGSSQAQTRLNHLVTVGNQAFANSNVAVNIRLVGTLQVNYPDTGSNETALEQLTGSNGSSSVTVPASLQPLRAARETYGADLVSLVRRFRDADHEGCGIAWMIGGGQTQIVPGHQMYGYSAISDSNGVQAPDNGHYCRDETLVHEIGHNLGSQHDDEAARGDNGVLDSNEYGRYPYSFGLKTTAANGNFFTVMSYGDTGQAAWRVFSNPQITYCGGRSCGIANQADNARSLRQTAPLIAAFRSAVGSGTARTDLNGDGRSDILWRHFGSGGNAAWLGGSTATQQAVATASLAWKLVAADDFDGDGRADLVWRNQATGQNLMWPQGQVGRGVALATVAGAAWQVAGSGDFDGDGRSDLLWRNTANGENRIWRSANASTMQTIVSVGVAWKVAGVGDFDGDGRSDIAWRNTSTGQNTYWRGGSNASSVAVATVSDQAWQVAAVDDFNGDGRADLLWRRSSTGDNVIWLGASNATQRAVSRVAPQNWSVAAAGDYDGDGSADILWRNRSDGSNVIWRSGNLATPIAVPRVADQNWKVVP